MKIHSHVCELHLANPVENHAAAKGPARTAP